MTNEPYATTQRVKEVVLPKPGAKSAKRIAQARWFRRGRNWRAGIEGRSSGLKRRHTLDRCRYQGTDGMERWVGWASSPTICAPLHRRLPSKQWSWPSSRVIALWVVKSRQCISLLAEFRTEI